MENFEWLKKLIAMIKCVVDDKLKERIDMENNFILRKNLLNAIR